MLRVCTWTRQFCIRTPSMYGIYIYIYIYIHSIGEKIYIYINPFLLTYHFLLGIFFFVNIDGPGPNDLGPGPTTSDQFR